MDIDDSEDQVVKEIPVHSCKELYEKLYLFQFPCRPADSDYNTKNIVSSRVKPKNGIIELDYALNTDDKFYDKYVGEDLARGNISKQNSKELSKQDSADRQRSENQLLDRITLQSQRSVLQKDIACYSVASLCDGKFCISSLHDSLSFLPNYEHVEKSKKSKVNAKNCLAADSVSSSEDEEDASIPAVQVTVKFSPRNLDKSKISQELSHQQYLMKIAEEPWCETTYHHNNSSLSLTKLEGLSKTSSNKAMSMLSLSEKEYLDILIPSETDELSQNDK